MIFRLVLKSYLSCTLLEQHNTRSLFQKSVLSKYLKGLMKLLLKINSWHLRQHFHNATIQQNIRSSKEEQYQEGFLDDLFAKVLGYT